MQRLILVVVLLLLTPIAFAQAYKWTDANGTTHYSETPPPTGTNYKRITTTGSVEPLAPPAATADKPAEASAVDSTPKTVADTPENRAGLCASLMNNLAALKGSTPVVMQQAGKPVALDDAARKTQMDKAQSQYNQYCQSR